MAGVRFCVCATALILLAGSPAGSITAQRAPGTTQASTDAPRLAIKAVSTVRSLAQWPGLSLSVNQNAYVAVFAVSRANKSALPIQVLFPIQPAAVRRVSARQTILSRRLQRDEALHLLNYGATPLIVAFASSVPPELSGFATGNTWGRDLLVDTLVATEQQLVELLAKTIYPAGVAFDALISEPSAMTAVPVVGGGFALGFGNEPISAARYTREIGMPAGLRWIDPIVKTSEVYMRTGGLPAGFADGFPFRLKGGAIAAFELGRVVYYPEAYRPPTAAQRAGAAAVGVPGVPPTAKTPDSAPHR